jgi:hypothetical protein
MQREKLPEERGRRGHGKLSVTVALVSSSFLAFSRYVQSLLVPMIRRHRLLLRLAIGALGAVVPLFGFLVQGATVDAAPTAWSVVSSPNAGSIDSLQDVSCAGTAFCLAVGAVSNNLSTSNEIQGVIEEYSDTGWTEITDPLANNDFLNGVSCVSNTFCAAVGTRDDSGAPLVETWNGTSM